MQVMKYLYLLFHFALFASAIPMLDLFPRQGQCFSTTGSTPPPPPPAPREVTFDITQNVNTFTSAASTPWTRGVGLSNITYQWRAYYSTRQGTTFVEFQVFGTAEAQVVLLPDAPARGRWRAIDSETIRPNESVTGGGLAGWGRVTTVCLQTGGRRDITYQLRIQSKPKHSYPLEVIPERQYANRLMNARRYAKTHQMIYKPRSLADFRFHSLTQSVVNL
uniref:Secreted in xylem 7 n=2 Tax=Fusarium oxysporum f. sp. pisi TaxID=179143 RepID=A0A0S3CV64_FUSOX|nr:secreted in xylem 7 [Fusarium oxysporum f. sp. pisi]BDB04155.1 secreted in xylem 7 [Fusarium oxysporum f. sp. pisi]